ncbi:GrpB family protein [Solicola gregarius]|uniref:GrpB family protein n=1 Tax=Solicola gregarius TaxID=2908642 RepID=A0AA46TIX3_9ACTN|nr:GrpB family protein [Solicola gregarius]UYM06100.1 GrpB family protein [Solicola gregarius]
MTSHEEPDDVYVRGQEILDGGRIELAAYDPQWPRLYDEEERHVRETLGDRVVLIEHTGSTSVPGLAAKPIIDMLLVVADPADEAAYVPDLERAGYVLTVREADWYEHRLFKRPTGIALHLHVHPPSSPEIRRNLAFRDHLRTNDADRALYERTKQELATRQWRYMQDYADAKGDVIEQIIARALRR